jgi:ribose/xylose/arabinose/galactoside ABC-type transport system permease subunit
MTTISPTGVRLGKVFTGRQQYVPMAATLGLLLIMFGAGSYRYDNFLDGQNVLNLFISNSYLLVMAIGMTFVILTGGIDLSVGSVMALTTMLCAALTQQSHWPSYVVIPLVLVVGTVLGAGMGAVIHYFEIQPFIVTLAGMFLARGACYLISINSIAIQKDPILLPMAETRIPLGPDMAITPSVIIALIVVAVAVYVLHYTRMGRNVYAIGGNEQSALLMGLPVARTKISVYALNGFCSALGGLLFTLYTLSGNPLHGRGKELSAIAAVVIGGTLLTGGTGYVIGTVFGVMVLGLIDSIIIFEGTLNAWWTAIVTGVLLLVFILLQRAVGARKT